MVKVAVLFIFSLIYFPITHTSIPRPQNPKISILISLCNFVEFVLLAIDNWLPTYIPLPYILPTSSTSWSKHWLVRTHQSFFTICSIVWLMRKWVKRKEKYTKLLHFILFYLRFVMFLISKHEMKIVLSISAQTGEQELFPFFK